MCYGRFFTMDRVLEIYLMQLSTPFKTPAWLIVALLIIGGCSSNNSPSEPEDLDNNDDSIEVPTRTQFLYTQTNDARENHVVGFSVNDNGDLIEIGVYETGSVGDADEGDFDSQSSVRVYEDFLIVANPGDASGESGITDGNSAITIFAINEDGSLQRVDQNLEVDGTQNADSRGVRAVSIDFHSEGETTWVAVANQGTNRVCVNPEVNGSLATCSDQFGNALGDLLADESPASDIQLFRLSESGVLTHEAEIAGFAANRGGASQWLSAPMAQKYLQRSWAYPTFHSPPIPLISSPVEPIFGNSTKPSEQPATNASLSIPALPVASVSAGAPVLTSCMSRAPPLMRAL